MRLEGSGRMVLLVTVVMCAALTLPAVAAADEDDREVRRTVTCTGSSRATIRLRADDDDIRVEFEIATRSTTRTWRVVLLHERRVAFQGAMRPRSGGRSVRLRRTVANWFGRDTIVVRASGPALETCRASATV